MDDTSATAGTKRLWPLGIFLFLSAALSWTVWLWPIDSRERSVSFVFGLEFKIQLFSMKLAIGNCLPGILAVIWTLFEGKCQFRRMLATLTNWRTPFQWYVFAVAFPFAVFLAPLEAVLFYFPTDHSLPSAIEFLQRFLRILPFATLWEELAWRAFALRKLESRYSRLASALLLGVYWGVWHIPLWLAEFDSIPISFFFAALINVIALSVIFAYLYHRSSESLPVVILLHTTYDVVATQTSLVAPQFDLYVNYASMVLTVCLAVAVAAQARRDNQSSA